ncbi:hypothetical protein ACFOON_10940 [Novosphingobium piscinae]|uniref:Acetyl-CoA carboxylase biotin carboxyl carrier protein subunit n=1 Tax=Novosphingobium piscinae TaxID=1507448 RepID=A0A7X1G259_9SPHN|nr:hypothetical protein [Novosphingobium piscinae]MBC2670582.1 hypothetical protein [Novosphingobium piscinae]
MIRIDDKALAAITNARALLDTMLAGGWNEVCVQGEEGDYFLARHPGTPNPLTAPPAAAVSPAAAASPPVQAPAARAVTAPHVGTVVWLAPVGTAVGEGAAVARLAVLDETVEVAAPAGGTVTGHGVKVGDLAEFKTELVTLQG